jgi:hypothetical protein
MDAVLCTARERQSFAGQASVFGTYFGAAPEAATNAEKRGSSGENRLFLISGAMAPVCAQRGAENRLTRQDLGTYRLAAGRRPLDRRTGKIGLSWSIWSGLFRQVRATAANWGKK